MPTGQESVVFNSQERAVSTDLDRMQAFHERDLAEALRYLLDVGVGVDDLDAGGLSVETLASTSPAAGEVFGGLLVQPQIGSLALLVQPGVLYCVNPDDPANPDNSVYQFVRDAGVQSVGALLMTANPSGSARVDVVECQPIFVVTETDNRDLFNPLTGLFTASTVTKATQSQLAYRVRAGVAGAGFPGTALGWLPLAVATVQAGATSNAQIDFWDVRPLVNDRAFGLANNAGYPPPATSYSGNGADFFVPGNLYPDVVGALSAGNNSGTYTNIVSGWVRCVVNGRRAGGVLIRGTPGVDPTPPGLDLNAAANQSPGLPSIYGSDGSLFYLYLCFPLGLPRWAMYVTEAYATDNGMTARVPRSPRGIPVVSNQAPSQFGFARSAVQMPNTLFGAATAVDANMCACLAAVPRRYGTGTQGTTWSLTGKYVSWQVLDPVGELSFGASAVPGTGDGTRVTYAAGGVSPAPLPANAVRCRFVAGVVLSPSAAGGTGWHYNKTLTSATGPASPRDTVNQGTVWLPSDYFNVTTVTQADCMAGDFDCPAGSIPTFNLFLYSGDHTVPPGTVGGVAMTLVTTGPKTTQGCFSGYWNP